MLDIYVVAKNVVALLGESGRGFTLLHWIGFTADFMEETIPALSKLCRANMDFLQISH